MSYGYSMITQANGGSSYYPKELVTACELLEVSQPCHIHGEEAVPLAALPNVSLAAY